MGSLTWSRVVNSILLTPKNLFHVKLCFRAKTKKKQTTQRHQQRQHDLNLIMSNTAASSVAIKTSNFHARLQASLLNLKSSAVKLCNNFVVQVSGRSVFDPSNLTTSYRGAPQQMTREEQPQRSGHCLGCHIWHIWSENRLAENCRVK